MERSPRRAVVVGIWLMARELAAMLAGADGARGFANVALYATLLSHNAAQLTRPRRP